MYLFNTDTYIRQMLPPHWRGTWRETILRVLLSPVQSVYERLIRFRSAVATNININGQVGVVEEFLNRKYAGKRVPYPYIELADSDTMGVVEVRVQERFWNQQSDIEKDIRRYLPMGRKLIFILKQI